MNNVIGFKLLFGKDFYEVAKSKREWLIGSDASLFMGVKVDKLGIIPEKPYNLLLDMIHNNKLTVTEFDEETGIGILMFQHPIPINLYLEFYPNDEVITD